MEYAKEIDKKPQITLPNQGQLAFADLINGLKSWRIWMNLGWQDIRLRYRRSHLGPFWITISMAVMIYSMGFFYSQLFKANLSEYFPHIACGVLVWTLISSLIGDLTDSFVESEDLIKQIKLPYSIYPLRVVSRNFIVFFHNAFAVIPIFIYFKSSIHLPLVFWGVFILGCYGFVFGVALAMLGARFRDVKPIIMSVLQVSFFITPIMWMPQMVPQRFSFIFYLNPFHHLIELIRAPLIGGTTSLYTICFTLGLLGVGVLLTLWILIRARCRIAFWV